MWYVFLYGVFFVYDYYFGDWFMGLNIFCWLFICFLFMDVDKVLGYFKLLFVSEMEILRNKLMEIN